MTKYHKTISFDHKTLRLVEDFITVRNGQTLDGNFSKAINSIIVGYFIMEKNIVSMNQELSWRRKQS